MDALCEVYDPKQYEAGVCTANDNNFRPHQQKWSEYHCLYLNKQLNTKYVFFADVDEFLHVEPWRVLAPRGHEKLTFESGILGETSGFL